PALVRDLRGGLEQNQALLRLQWTHSPGKQVPRQRKMIKVWVLPAQRELETAFAVLVSVTSPGATTRLGQHSHNIITEGHFCRKRGLCRNQAQSEQKGEN